MARVCGVARAGVLVLSALLLAGCSPDTRFAVEESTSVIVADFVNTTRDPVFESSLKHALAIALGQSPRLRVLSGARVADSLRAMNRSADERVTADLAWEIAAREAVDLLVLGSIGRERDDHVITLEAVAWRDGATVARETVQARSRAQVIDALGRAATSLRRGLGEPPESIARTEVPLSQVMSLSLEALAHYAQGRELSDKGRHALAAPHYCRALALDPGFDLARAALGTSDSCRDAAHAPRG